MTERLIEKLKKIHALAESGIEGERENAREIFAELCEKHNVNPQTFDDEKKSKVKFMIRDRQDEILLYQVVVHVCGIKTHFLRKDRKTKARWFELTDAQEKEVNECLRHYRRLWQTHLTDAIQAFIYANKIFGISADKDRPELSLEEIQELKRISEIMRGMEPSPWKKRMKLSRGDQ